MSINYIDEWQFVSEAYNGTGGFYDGSALDKFGRETDGTEDTADDSYGDRKDASMREYENLYVTKVSRYIGYLLKTTPQRNTDNTMLNLIIEDVNRRKESIDVFMQNFAKNTKARGVNLLLVDTPEMIPDNMQDQINKRAVPYFVEVLPERVTEYKLDDVGKFEYVAFADTQDNSTYGQSDVEDIVRYYDKTEWRVYDSNGNITSQGEHGFMECPVLICSEKGEFESLGEFAQLAGMSKRLFNLDSELKLMLRGQTFSILTIWTEKGAKPDIKLGTDNALMYSGDHPPAYISSDVAQADVYETKITKVKESMDRVGYDVSTTQAQESGIALSLKFEGLNGSLASFAEKIQNTERAAWDLICENLSISTESIDIVYEMDFTITDIQGDIEILEGVNTIADLPQYKATKLKSIISEDLKGTNVKTLEAINKEIDALAKMSDVG